MVVDATYTYLSDIKNNPYVKLDKRIMATYLLNMTLHLKWCVKLLITMMALCQICKIKVLLFLSINVTLNVRHQTNIVVQHLVAVPTLHARNNNNTSYLTRGTGLNSSTLNGSLIYLF